MNMTNYSALRILNALFLLGVLGIVSCQKDLNSDLLPPAGDRTLKATRYVNGSSIQAAIDSATAGDLIDVAPGTYYEQIFLKDGVNLHLQEGVVIENNSGVVGPALTDNGVAVTCSITGFGVIRRSGSTSAYSHAVKISNANSQVTLQYKKIESTVNSPTVDVADGMLHLLGGLITGKGIGIKLEQYGNPRVVWDGDSVYSQLDYGVLSSGHFQGNGFVLSDGNSAIEPSGNLGDFMEFSGHAKSTAMYGLEHAGGSAYIHDAILESTGPDAADGSAISNYSGDTLKLSNVTLHCTYPTALSLETQGSIYGSQVEILTNVYANKPIQTNPPENITLGMDKLFSIPVSSLTYTLVTKGKSKAVTLHWSSENNNFTILKDGVVVGTATSNSFTYTLPNNFRQAVFTVKSNIPTLNSSSASLLVTK